MAKPVVNIEGLDKLRRALRKTGDNLDDLKAAHQAAAGMVLRLALFRLPQRSGRLKASLRVGKGAASSLVREGRASVPYAGPVEFGGWPKGRPFVKEGRYLFPAAKQATPAIEAIYARAVQKEADKFNDDQLG